VQPRAAGRAGQLALKVLGLDVVILQRREDRAGDRLPQVCPSEPVTRGDGAANSVCAIWERR